MYALRLGRVNLLRSINTLRGIRRVWIMKEMTGLLVTTDGSFNVVITPSRQTFTRSGFSKGVRISLLDAQSHRCAICQGPLGLHDSHIDHIVPLASGGSDDYTNLQLTHMNCNLRKGTRPNPAQGRMPWA